MGTFEIAEGYTGPLDFQLKADDAAVVLSTGDAATLILKAKDGTLISSTDDASILSSTAGTVRYKPDANDLKVSLAPYTARFQITTSSGDNIFYPSGLPDIWKVYAQ